MSRNRRRHEVSLDQGQLHDDNETLDIDSESCALCHHYINVECKHCPISSCGDAYDTMMFNNRVVPMINLLKKALIKKR